MENYKIHFIGEGVSEVKTQEDARYHLATKYGVSVYNKLVKLGLIVFTDNFAKISPFKIIDNSTDYTNQHMFKIIPLYTTLKRNG